MKIEINLKIIFIILLFFLINNLSTYIIFLVSILIHELAHLLVGILIGGKLERFIVSPFGMSLEFFSYGKDKRSYRILFYVIGPVINFIIAFITKLFFITNELTTIIIYTNIAIAFFNLMPIMPLDGGKITKEFLKCFIENEKANKFIIHFSKFYLMIMSFAYGILIIKIKNILSK